MAPYTSGEHVVAYFVLKINRVFFFFLNISINRRNKRMKFRKYFLLGRWTVDKKKKIKAEHNRA